MIESLILQALISAGVKSAKEAVSKEAARRIESIRARFRKAKDEELARIAVDEVLAAAAAFRPTRAVSFSVHSGPAQSGNDGTGIYSANEAGLRIQWTNLAPFEVTVANLKAEVALANSVQLSIDEPEQFDIDAQGHLVRHYIATLSSDSPPIPTQPVVDARIQLSATVFGPWPDEPQSRHSFSGTTFWLPVLDGGRLDEADIRQALRGWLTKELKRAFDFEDAGHPFIAPLNLPELEHHLGLPHGAAREPLRQMLAQRDFEIVDEGPTLMTIRPSRRLVIPPL